jgi:rare lipoprotein A
MSLGAFMKLPKNSSSVRKRAVLWCVLAALFVSGCSETRFVAHTFKRLGWGKEEAPQGKYKIGNPYEVYGVWYYPEVNNEYDKTGIASWYGSKFHGLKTANGEVFDMNAISAAHKTLPLPTYVKVTNLENGRSLALRVNDRGPFVHNRIIDLSRRAAELLGMKEKGIARVRVRVLADKSRAIAARMKNEEFFAKNGKPIKAVNLRKPAVDSQELPPPSGVVETPGYTKPTSAQPKPLEMASSPLPSRDDLKLGVVTLEPAKETAISIQAGAFSQMDNAERVRGRLSGVGKVKIMAVRISGQNLFRVRIGPLVDIVEADKTLESVIQAGYPAARIVVD